MLTVVAEWFHVVDGRTDRQTGMKKLTVARENDKKRTSIPQEHKARRVISGHKGPSQTKKYEGNQLHAMYLRCSHGNSLDNCLRNKCTPLKYLLSLFKNVDITTFKKTTTAWHGTLQWCVTDREVWGYASAVVENPTPQVCNAVSNSRRFGKK